MWVTCPDCLWQAGEAAFDIDIDICFCPKCGCEFMVEDDDENTDEEEDQ